MDFNFLNNINYYQLLNDLVIYSTYILLLLGLWFIFNRYIVALIRNKKTSYRFRTIIQEKPSNINKLIKHIVVLITIVQDKKKKSHVYTFFILSIAFLVLAFLVLYKQISLISTLVLSVMSGLLPYAYLQIRLRNIRVSSSYEAEGLITEIINQYKINYFNMIEAIDKTIPFLKDYPYVKKSVTRLSMSIKDHKGEEELNEALREFTYSIGTEWAVMLSNNIYLAVTDGYKVVEALEDIQSELKDAKKALEDGKRNNNEGFAIVKFLVPILYFGTIYIAVTHFNFTIVKFYNYQVKTAIGVKFFLIIIVLYLFCVITIIFHKRQKFDI